METAFVSLIAYGVYTLTSGLALTIMLAMHDGAKALSPQFQAYGVGYIVASPLTIAVLWIAIRTARREFAEYLALNWPSSGELLRALAITAMLLLAESLVGFVVGAEEVSPNPYVGAGQARRIFDLLDRRLYCGTDHGGVRPPWFHVSRLVAVFPPSGWIHRADVDIVGDDAYPVRLAWAFFYLRHGSCSRPFSLAQQFDVADGDGPFSHQHLPSFCDGPATLRPSSSEGDNNGHRDRREDRLQRDDLRQ